MIDGTSNLHWMRPSPEAQERIGMIRNAYAEAERSIRTTLNPSRESSLALTKLEESCQWAIKSVCVEDKPTAKPE